MGSALTLYDQARAALEAARSVDDLLEVRNQAEALKAYAKQAKDASMIAAATEIKLRSERRLGVLMADQPKHPGGGDHRVPRGPSAPITLKEAGIDKHLADRARTLAGLDESRFADVLATSREKAAAGAARTVSGLGKDERRSAREKALSARARALPGRRYGLIYADPPWRFEVRSAQGLDRAAENHYPTMTVNELAGLDVASLAAPDCLLACWVTAPLLDAALSLIVENWGFVYRSFTAWDKGREGTGYWVRSRVELLVLATIGRPPAPLPGRQLPGILDYPRGRHSEKPPQVAQMLAALYPSVPRLEMFARGGAQDGWDRWGNEALDLQPE